jgi:2-haloacid dehalogenase
VAGGAAAVVLAFDVNETLLDLRPLDDVFERVFGNRALRPAWFQQMLQLSFVGGLTGEYVDFTTAQEAALRMLARRAGHELGEDDVEQIVGVLSADEVKQLKPGPKPYHLVADRMGAPISAVRLVAAHSWDVSGALAAGARATFVARAGMVPSPIGAQPDMIVADLRELADQLDA